MQHILENKYEDQSMNVYKPSILDAMVRSEYSTKRPMKIFNKQIKDFNSDMDIPNLKENFKRVAYHKVVEQEQDPVIKAPGNLEK